MKVREVVSLSAEAPRGAPACSTLNLGEEPAPWNGADSRGRGGRQAEPQRGGKAARGWS